MRTLVLAATIAVVSSISAANAATMFVHDSSGNLAKVNTTTGAVDVIGAMGVVMTDIAFDPLGNLFGISFTNLYRIDASTASPTLVGAHNVPGGNALVFDSAGVLYSAGASSANLYTIDPSTGSTTSLGSTGFSSGGDLAFAGGDLYLASGASSLVRINLGDLANSVLVGPFGVPNVFGIATAEDGTMFGVAGTSIFTVDLTTGAAVNPVSFAGQGLGNAFGQGFFTEAGAPPPAVIPLPPSAVMLLSSLLFVGVAARQRSRRRQELGATVA